MTKRTWTCILLLGFFFAASATAATPSTANIDFEPPEGSVFLDNAPLDMLTSSAFTVTMGVDVDADKVIDFPLRLENRGDDAINAYTLGAIEDDADLSSSSSGGEWLIRRPKNGEPGTVRNLDAMLIFNFDNLDSSRTSSLFGEIWDMDLDEEFLITLVDGDTTLDEMVFGPGTEAGRGVASRFEFTDIDFPESVSLQIRLLNNGDDAGGFGIDNIGVSLVPEPSASIWLLPFTIAMLHFVRGRERNYRHRTSARGIPRS